MLHHYNEGEEEGFRLNRVINEHSKRNEALLSRRESCRKKSSGRKERSRSQLLNGSRTGRKENGGNMPCQVGRSSQFPEASIRSVDTSVQIILSIEELQGRRPIRKKPVPSSRNRGTTTDYG